MITTIKKILSNSSITFSLIAVVCFCALAAAFIAEGILLLEPCELCIMQRYPFVLGLAIGLIGLALRKNNLAVSALLSIASLGFLTNSAIATYHTGVEQHWWESAVDGCSVTFEEDTSGQSILENIMSAPMGDCSQIPWQDPLLGLSMANWNIPFCFGLFLFCAFSLLCIRKSNAS